MSGELQAMRSSARTYHNGLVFDTYEQAVRYAELCPDLYVEEDLVFVIKDWVYKLTLLHTSTNGVYRLFAEPTHPAIEETGATQGYMAFSREEFQTFRASFPDFKILLSTNETLLDDLLI